MYYFALWPPNHLQADFSQTSYAKSEGEEQGIIRLILRNMPSCVRWIVEEFMSWFLAYGVCRYLCVHEKRPLQERACLGEWLNKRLHKICVTSKRHSEDLNDSLNDKQTMLGVCMLWMSLSSMATSDLLCQVVSLTCCKTISLILVLD